MEGAKVAFLVVGAVRSLRAEADGGEQLSAYFVHDSDLDVAVDYVEEP